MSYYVHDTSHLLVETPRSNDLMTSQLISCTMNPFPITSEFFERPRSKKPPDP